MTFRLTKLAAISALCTLPAFGFAQDETTEAETEATESESSPAPVRIANGQRFGAWTVTCEAVAVGETACVLSQRLVRSSDNAFLAEVLAFWSGDGEQSFLAARVPNGVYFPSGFAFKPEDSDERAEFVWQSCSADLCEALLSEDLEALRAYAEAEGGVVAGYRPGLRSEPLIFRLDLTGIGDGLEALKAATITNAAD
ncbi:invasion associated locus B family protein [Maritimibacter sp. UBA3975]|uniref:invasion associated locus B family protein n=1 Tax=Maritimibacter sp. UBA3975 TaxID=1946833 RepID=UPI0025BA4069|nr:invasion associated locus B family protein [Maritimibacter sp. UBA3975]